MPMAVRKNDSTMMIRVKHVTMIKIDGANDSTVNSAINCNTRPVIDPPSPPKFSDKL